MAKGIEAPSTSATVVESGTNDIDGKGMAGTTTETTSKTDEYIEVQDGISPAKRPRSPGNATENGHREEKRARTDLERIRYSLYELLGMRHSRRLAAVNGHVISKHAHEHTGVVASSGELVLDKSGRLRTSDILVGVGAGEPAPTFADMQLPSAIVAGLAAVGFTRPSAVQHRGVPVARLGVDVIAQAKSGTGKTGVFGTVVTECALPAAPGKVVAVVLTPGREVSRQVGAVLSTVLHAARLHAREAKVDEAVDQVQEAKKAKEAGADTVDSADAAVAEEPAPESTRTPTSAQPSTSTSPEPPTLGDVAVLVGGAPDAADAKPLHTATVAVGTPARVRALLAKGILDARAVKMLVLDEADRLLNAGAGFDLADVVGFLPPTRQTLAFSATYTPALVARLRAIMRTPCLVWLGDQGPGVGGEDHELNKEDYMWRSAVLRGVRQSRIDVTDASMKRSMAIQVLQTVPYTSCIIFVARRDTARDVAKRLKKSRITARHISAALSNAQRKHALDAFRNGTASVLVATDMLARGVSFDRCDLVIHLDTPPDTATYLHRVGRAGRFGKLGTSIVIVEPSQRPDLAAIETRIGHVPKFDFQNIPTRTDAVPSNKRGDNKLVKNSKRKTSSGAPVSNLEPEASSEPCNNATQMDVVEETVIRQDEHMAEAETMKSHAEVVQNDDEEGYAAGYELARKLIEWIRTRTRS